jgi:hypothetical protein
MSLLGKVSDRLLELVAPRATAEACTNGYCLESWWWVDVPCGPHRLGITRCHRQGGCAANSGSNPCAYLHTDCWCVY